MSDKLMVLLFGLGIGICIYPGLRWLLGTWVGLVGLALVLGCVVAIVRRTS